MTIETERLILRPWQEADRAAYAALQSDPVVRRFFPAPLSRAEADESFDSHLVAQASRDTHFMAARSRVDGAFVGLLGIGYVPDIVRQAIPSHPELEIGWVINAPFWGQGLAPEGARACLDHAWKRGLPEIVAFTAAINLPSQRVMEKIGMTRSATDDFEHPRISEAHPLRSHVLYRIVNPAA